MSTRPVALPPWRLRAVAGVPGCLAGSLLSIAVAWSLMDLPRVGLPVVVLLAVYFIALLRFPRLWLIVLPLATVAIDLTPWTGRFLYNEFDGLILMSVAAALITRQYRGDFGMRHWRGLLLLLYAALFIANLAAPSVILGAMGTQFFESLLQRCIQL